MTRFSGFIGFVSNEQTSPGVYEEVVHENRHRGDVIRNAVRWDGNTSQINEGITINNSISIVCDHYTEQHISDIRYVVWMGQRWKVSNITIQSPRLILELGGVYNGPIATKSSEDT